MAYQRHHIESRERGEEEITKREMARSSLRRCDCVTKPSDQKKHKYTFGPLLGIPYDDNMMCVQDVLSRVTDW